MDSKGSPSSRRAWIEMITASSTSSVIAVALLAEGVDRNFQIHSHPPH